MVMFNLVRIISFCSCMFFFVSAACSSSQLWSCSVYGVSLRFSVLRVSCVFLFACSLIPVVRLQSCIVTCVFRHSRRWICTVMCPSIVSDAFSSLLVSSLLLVYVFSLILFPSVFSPFLEFDFVLSCVLGLFLILVLFSYLSSLIHVCLLPVVRRL